VALTLLVAAPASARFGFMRAWGTVGSGERQFALPDGIGVDNGGTVWVADRDNNRVSRFSFDGRFRAFPALRRQHRSPAPGRLNLPYDVAPDALGNVYVADTHNHRIQVFSPTGKLLRRWGRRGSGDGEFFQPRGIAIDPFGNVWVADHENYRVQKFTARGRFLGKFGRNGGDGTLGGGWGEFNAPRGLSSDAAGNIYVADDANHRIVKLANDGTWLAAWGRPDLQPGAADGEFNLPYGTAVDPDGHVWVADTLNHRLVELSPDDGHVLSRWGAGGGDGSAGGGAGEFNELYNVAIDCVGNVYATDKANWRVQKLGDPAFGRPVCPPEVTVGSVQAARGGFSADVACDRPCRARAVLAASVRGKRVVVRGPVRVLRSAGLVTVQVRLSRADRRALRGARRGDLRLSGSGAPGAVRTVVRRVRLGG
jgi:DNA-binding beta-propeller fold protein YncE